MNLYNPYLPLLLAQASMPQPPRPTMSMNNLLMAQLATLALTSSNSLNGKRNFLSQPEFEPSLPSSYKKLKLSEDTSVPNITNNNMPIQKTNVKFNQSIKKPHNAHQDIVVLDEEEDCLIIDEPLTNNHINLPLVSGSLQIESGLVKPSAIIVIDDDDQLTCQSTPQPGLENLELQKQDSDASETVTTDITEKNEEGPLTHVNANQCAKIPSFELSVVNRGQRKSRKVKPVWNPECYDNAEFENWTEKIGKTVGIQISGQEKVLKTMKNFDMNLETALERIKRNKAHYKDYFRMRKLYKS